MPDMSKLVDLNGISVVRDWSIEKFQHFEYIYPIDAPITLYTRDYTAVSGVAEISDATWPEEFPDFLVVRWNNQQKVVLPASYPTDGNPNQGVAYYGYKTSGLPDFDKYPCAIHYKHLPNQDPVTELLVPSDGTYAINIAAAHEEMSVTDDFVDAVHATGSPGYEIVDVVTSTIVENEPVQLTTVSSWTEGDLTATWPSTMPDSIVVKIGSSREYELPKTAGPSGSVAAYGEFYGGTPVFSHYDCAISYSSTQTKLYYVSDYPARLIVTISTKGKEAIPSEEFKLAARACGCERPRVITLRYATSSTFTCDTDIGTIRKDYEKGRQIIAKIDVGSSSIPSPNGYFQMFHFGNYGQNGFGFDVRAFYCSGTTSSFTINQLLLSSQSADDSNYTWRFTHFKK